MVSLLELIKQKQAIKNQPPIVLPDVVADVVARDSIGPLGGWEDRVNRDAEVPEGHNDRVTAINVIPPAPTIRFIRPVILPPKPIIELGPEYYADESEEKDFDLETDKQLVVDEYDTMDEEEIEDDLADPAIPDILAGVQVTLDPSQIAAVVGLARVQYGCLIGAAGTGKTTTTRFLLNTLINGDAQYGVEPMRITKIDIRRYNEKVKVVESSIDSSEEEDENGEYEEENDNNIPTIALVAYTGQATQVLKKNMPKEWRRNCMTIHSCLGYAPVEYVKEDGKVGMRFEPSYTEFNRMPWDVIIVDESSMVNIHLWHQLLDASKDGCRFYFIGDLNQLPPPIGVGVLGFALAKWPVFELTVVHRQADDAANRIVDTAWRILQGKAPEFDDPKTNKRWRVIGFQIEHDPRKAHSQIINLAKGLSQKRVAPESDIMEPFIYNPWRDRILTCMNGFNEEDPNSLLGQFPINDSLSQIFANPDEPRIIIDAKKATKKFAVGYRIMATKNEPPNAVDRVTNGLTGIVTAIARNPRWHGDARLVGIESEVDENRRTMTENAIAMMQGKRSAMDEANDVSASMDEFDALMGGSDLSTLSHTSEEEERQGGPASHIVSIKFDNGATRNYGLNAEVEQLQIAYASTTHKAQGAEMPTAIIVVHHGQSRMLCRENLYTAVTRASQRVIIFYTDFGMRTALMTQKVSGNNLKEKLVNYIRLLGGEDGTGFKMINVRLTHEDK